MAGPALAVPPGVQAPGIAVGGDVSGNTVKGTGSTTARSLADLAGEVVNARSMGLVCDGVTDNAAVLAAIATRTAATARQTVLFPPAAQPCLTSQPLAATASTTYVATPGTVTLKPTPGSTANPLLFLASGVSDVLVQGVGFDGGGTGFGTTSNLATVYQAARVVFDQTSFQNTRGVGLVFSTAVSQSGVRDSRFTNVGNHWQATGLAADQKQGVSFCCGAGNDKNFVASSTFDTIGLDAVSFTNQTDFLAQGNRFLNVGGAVAGKLGAGLNGGVANGSLAGGAAIYGAASSGAAVLGNVTDGAGGNGIDLYQVGNASITGNVARRSGGNGISFAAAANATIAGNTALDNNQARASVTSAPQAGFFLTGGRGSDPALANVVLAANVATDDQPTKTQNYGVQLQSGSTGTANLFIDQANQFTGNAVADFGEAVTGYSAQKVSASVSTIGGVGSSPNIGVQLNVTGTGALMLGTHDGSTGGGNLPGSYAVDLCTQRQDPSQVASGQDSGCLYGNNNAVLGPYASAGGQWNTADGMGSRAWGQFAQARYRIGADVWASGLLAGNGDAQMGHHVLRAVTTSTAAKRLTTDASAAGTQNCVNLPIINQATTPAVYGLSIRLVAIDLTTPANSQSYFQPHALLFKTGAASTTTYQAVGTALTGSNGTAGTVAVAADTTNACLAITWTAPNADTWHVVAGVDDVEAY